MTTHTRLSGVEETPPQRDFGRRVRDLRWRARLTQEQLAHLTHLSPRSIRNIERGWVNRPHRQSVRLLATVLGLEDAELTEFFRLSHGDFWTRGHA